MGNKDYEAQEDESQKKDSPTANDWIRNLQKTPSDFRQSDVHFLEESDQSNEML